MTWTAYIAPVISILGALASWYWAFRRMRWDAGRELGAFRSETLVLIANAKLLDHPMWSEGVSDFQGRRLAWGVALREKEPLLGRQSRRSLLKFVETLQQAEMQVFGLRRVFTGDPAEDEGQPRSMSSETRAAIEKMEAFLQDPHALTK